MNGTDHYLAGERLLLDASFVDDYGNPVTRDGRLMQPGEHAALVARAQAHFAAAQAAAAALPTVTQYMGDSDEVTQWGRITGADTTWIVVMAPDGDTVIEYGPFRDRDDAAAFAEFLTAEVNPAHVSSKCTDPRTLRSPVRELLAWGKRFGGDR